MLRLRLTPSLRALVVYGLVVAIALPVAPLVQGAEKWIDLDGDPSNGAESRVVTRVLQAFPVEIENIVYNNATGKSYRFVIPGAGPGGFESKVANGPDVGTKWVWTTLSQVYSIDSPAVFSASRGVSVIGGQQSGVQVFGQDEGTFSVPGKSIFPTDITLSNASLTSSLITFFSPPQFNGLCNTGSGGGVYTRTLTNPTNEPKTFKNEEIGCCQEDNQLICEGECVSYQTDENNCGDCGVTCAFDEECNNGVCESICPEGQILCGETAADCVDPSADPTHCGGCDVTCLFDEFCDLGSCESICPEGETLCGETAEDCYDLQTDVNNCGACDFACGILHLCADGVCEPDCPPGETLCIEIEACVDLQTDPSNCGDCGVQCLPDELCTSGVCACPVGETLCGESCVDLLIDPGNCGTCGNVCPPAQFCSGGTCVCPEGGTLCGDVCVDVQTDPSNCGSCGVVCAPEQSCTGGACVCPTGETLCGDDCVDLLLDPANCGTCGNVCPAAQFCSGGACVCPTGETLCGDDCVDLLSDTANCGTCGNQCPPETICYEGSCVCEDPSLSLCSDTCVDVQTDPDNCGACGTPCGEDEFCEGGTCLPICPPGYTLCGTECVDVTSDPDNCGGCGNQCGENQTCIPDCSRPPDCSGICLDCPGGECPTGTGSSASSTPTSFRAPRDRSAPRALTERRSLRQESSTESSLLERTSETELRAPAREDAAPPRSDRRVSSDRRRPLDRQRDRGTVTQAEDDAQAASPPEAPATRTVEPAPKCGLQTVEITLQPNESYTECFTGSVVAKEAFTKAQVFSAGGDFLGGGPCAQLVPDPDAVIGSFLPSPVDMIVTSDDSKDFLPQPGETVCMSGVIQNLGTEIWPASTVVVDSPADGFNPIPMSFSQDTISFDALQPVVPGTCETPPQFFPETSIGEFCFQVPEFQEGDVARRLRFTWPGATDSPEEMTFVVGIGSVCDPTNHDGEAHDGTDGFQGPVNAQLVPAGNPVNISSRRFNVGSTIPLKVTYTCGGQPLNTDNLDLSPEIIWLKDSDGVFQSLEGIDGRNNANPDNPLFSGSGTLWDFQFRTENREPGTYVIGIRNPNGSESEAGFILRP